MNIFPADYMKKKRLYIVRNLEEINQQEYENDDMDAELGKAQGRKGAKDPSISATPKKLQTASNASVQPKEIEVDKWRPFYFDLFNRVGNLTVLSLR